jgi:antitoxin component YwqK of YwqJK toxin-antitoxin module
MESTLSELRMRGLIILLLSVIGFTAVSQDTIVILEESWSDRYSGSGIEGENLIVQKNTGTPINGCLVQMKSSDTVVVMTVLNGLLNGNYYKKGKCSDRSFYQEKGSYDLGKKEGVWTYRYCFRDELNPKARISKLEKYEHGCIVRSVEYHNVKGNVKSAIRNYKSVKDDRGGWSCIPHGEWKEFAENRNPDLVGQYVDGEKHGEWINYNHETLQQKEDVETYQNGKPHGPWLRYCLINNEILREHNYKDGCQDGYQYDYVCQEQNGRHFHKQANFEKYVDGCMVYREYSYSEDRTIERYKLQKAVECQEFWPVAHGKWEYYEGETLLKTEIYDEGNLVGQE